jgi:hypothetical protein
VKTFSVNSLIDKERALEKPSNPRRRGREDAMGPPAAGSILDVRHTCRALRYGGPTAPAHHNDQRQETN